MNEGQWLWDHFKFNAEQRLKVFHFFVMLSIFSDGGVFTAIQNNVAPFILLLLGLFIVILACVFWCVDMRCRQLLRLAYPAIKAFEQSFREASRLFTNDSLTRSRFIRFTFAFQTLLICQLVFGLGVAGYAGFKCFIE